MRTPRRGPGPIESAFRDRRVVIGLLSGLSSTVLTAIFALVFFSKDGVNDVVSKRISEVLFAPTTSDVTAILFAMMGTSVGIIAVYTLLFPTNGTSRKIYIRTEAEANRVIDRIIMPTAGARSKSKAHGAPQTEALSMLSSIFRRSRNSLKIELDRIKGSSTQALYFGIFFSFAAIGISFYAVIFLQKSSDQIDGLYGFLSYYLPKILIVIIPEIIALFFLNLYVINQRDLRAIRNEITNLDLKEASIAVNILLGTPTESMAKILEILARSERNFVLQKGERVANEADQFDALSANMQALANAFSSVTKKEE